MGNFQIYQVAEYLEGRVYTGNGNIVLSCEVSVILFVMDMIQQEKRRLQMPYFYVFVSFEGMFIFKPVIQMGNCQIDLNCYTTFQMLSAKLRYIPAALCAISFIAHCWKKWGRCEIDILKCQDTRLCSSLLSFQSTSITTKINLIVQL